MAQIIGVAARLLDAGKMAVERLACLGDKVPAGAADLFGQGAMPAIGVENGCGGCQDRSWRGHHADR